MTPRADRQHSGSRCPRCFTALSTGAAACTACGTRFVPPNAAGARVGGAVLAVVVAAGAWWAWRSSDDSAAAIRAPAGTASETDSGAAIGPEPAASPRTAAPGVAPGVTGPGSGGLDADAGSAGSIAAAEAATAPLAAVRVVTRDGAGRELRRIMALPVAADGACGLLVPLATLNGALAAHTDDGIELVPAGIDGDDLALLAASDGGAGLPAGTGAASVAPFAELGVGCELCAAATGPDGATVIGAVVGTVIERADGDALLRVRALEPLARQFVLDGRGRVAGIGREPLGEEAWLVALDGALLRLGRARPVSFALLQDSRFGRDPAALRELAGWYAAGSVYAPALERWLAAIALDPGLVAELASSVRAAVELALREARHAERLDELLPLLLDAGRRFDREPRVLHACGLALLDQGDPEAALPWFVAAVAHARGDAAALEESLRLAFLHAGEAARADARPADAIVLLEEGLARFREEPALLLALGYAYYELPDRERAAIVLTKAASLDERHAAALEPLLATLAPRAEPAAGAAVEIRFTRGGGAIRSRARFADRVDADVIIDTGASLTAISDRLAAELGLDLRKPERTLSVNTANGRVTAPVVLLANVDVAGARVTHVEAVVLQLLGDDALIGLNFLEHFDLSLDSARGILRLTARR